MLENMVNQAAIAIFQMRRLAGVRRDPGAQKKFAICAGPDC